MNMPASSRTRIKMCGFTREQDVDCAVTLGVDAIGFVLYEHSARHISIERATELARRLPPFVTPVLLFVNAASDQVQRACSAVPAAWLQFHGDETPQECVALAQTVQRPYLRAARIPTGADASFDLLEFAQQYTHAQGLLLDAHVDGYGGGGKTFNWSRQAQNVNAHLVLSGGLDAANVTEGIAQWRTRGRSLAVDVSSGIEVSKGIKDPHKMQAFVAAVRAADAAPTVPTGQR